MGIRQSKLREVSAPLKPQFGAVGRRCHFLFLQPIPPRHPVQASLRLASLGFDRAPAASPTLLPGRGNGSSQSWRLQSVRGPGQPGSLSLPS